VLPLSDDDIRGLASYALGQMLQKGSSVEVAVRWVLRIATLKGHLHWQMWALLNLGNFTADLISKKKGDHEPNLHEAIKLLGDMFPDGDGHLAGTEALDKVISAYTQCRRIRDGELIGLSLGRLEEDRKELRRMAHKSYKKELNDWFNKLSTVLNTIKNRAQIYLSSIEAGIAPPN
jgi:hypothetical protein